MIPSRRAAMLAAVPATAALAGLASAQSAPPPPTPPTGAAPANLAKDPQFAPCLLIGGRKQIENCAFALTKVQSADVKAFAKAEIDEHEAMKKTLKGQGYDYPVTAGTAGTAGKWVVTAGPAQPSPDAAAMVVLDHEVADQCVANFKAELGAKAGREADKCFVGTQLHEHMGLLDKVQTFRRNASPAMEAVLAAGQKIIETHIATLKGLMASLEKA